MCNTVSIHYSCNHFAQFHRSTCRSTVWVTKTTSKTKNRSRTRVDNNDSNDGTPSRGRTLERASDKTSASSSPSSNDALSPPPPPKLVSKAACKSTSNIVLRTQQRCGPCQRTFKRGFLQIRRARQELPSHKKRKHLKRGRPISGGSPLKHELTLEELLGSADEVVTDSTSRETMYSTSQNINGITRLLHLEPARFWRCWRRFDDLGRRYVDLIRS